MLLRVADLHVSYGSVAALKGVSLEIEQGEVVALIGANGGGKSTLVKAIAGAIHPQRGSIQFLGQEVSTLAPFRLLRMGISLVPEGRGVLGSLTVLENLKMGAYLRKDKSKVNKDLQRLMEQFHFLGERKGQKANSLSGGEQQMLAIARGLMSEPKLLMMDEPSWGLAPVLVSEVFNTIAELCKEGTTLLLAEQNALKALQCTNRAYVLETGSIILSGRASDLLHDDRVRRAYLGE